MIPRVFADTSALYALADESDANHAAAAAFYGAGGHEFVLTNYVFSEILSLITKRRNKAAAVRFGETLRNSPQFHLRTLDPALEEKAWDMFSRRFKDKGFDLVDCASFVLMEQLKVRHAFSFDAHFRQAGYTLFP